MRLTLAPLTVLAVLLAPAAAQAAGLPLQTGGVRAQNTSHGVKVTFGPKAKDLYKRIAGRRVTVGCTTVPPTDGPVLDREDSGASETTILIAPKKRRALRFSDGRTTYDTCRLQARRTRKRKGGGRDVITVVDLSLPLTQRGAVFLDERRIAAVLDVAIGLVEPPKGRTNYRTTAEVLGRLDQLVALDDPNATPPPRFVGLYSDGAQHATAVAVTSSGRRVFIDVNADVMSTNLTTVLFRG
jgi:hypothetical protein